MDLTKINEMLTERRNIVAQQREMNDRLYKDGKPERDFNSEEQGKYDTMEARVKVLTAAVQREKGIGEAEKQFASQTDQSVRAALEDLRVLPGLLDSDEREAWMMVAIRARLRRCNKPLPRPTGHDPQAEKSNHMSTSYKRRKAGEESGVRAKVDILR